MLHRVHITIKGNELATVVVIGTDCRVNDLTTVVVIGTDCRGNDLTTVVVIGTDCRGFMVMVLSTIFNNITVISWRSVLLV